MDSLNANELCSSGHCGLYSAQCATSRLPLGVAGMARPLSSLIAGAPSLGVKHGLRTLPL